jgi:hypothetical protein
MSAALVTQTVSLRRKLTACVTKSGHCLRGSILAEIRTRALKNSGLSSLREKREQLYQMNAKHDGGQSRADKVLQAVTKHLESV